MHKLFHLSKSPKAAYKHPPLAQEQGSGWIESRKPVSRKVKAWQTGLATSVPLSSVLASALQANVTKEPPTLSAV